MHKKYFNFILPIFGAAVVVGSGFSAWVFSNEVKATELGLEGSITLEPVANLTATLESDLTNFQLDLDQGGINNTTVTDGIYLIKEGASKSDTDVTNELSFNITYTLKSDQALLDEDWATITAQSKYSVSVTLPETLKAFVSVTADAPAFTTNSFEKGTEENTYVGKATIKLVASYTTKVEGNDEIKGKPTTRAEYDVMEKAFKDIAADDRMVKVAVNAVTFEGGVLPTPTV